MARLSIQSKKQDKKRASSGDRSLGGGRGEGGGGEGGQGFGGKNLKIEKIHSESQDSKIGCILVRN